MSEILTKPDVMRLLGVSRTTLNRWLREGRIPPPLPLPSPRWIKAELMEALHTPREHEEG